MANRHGRGNTHFPTQAIIRAHYKTFTNLLDRATHRFNSGDLENACIYASIAAEYAWRHHPGLFSSTRLELLIQRLGNHLTAGRNTSSQRRPIRSAGPMRILHVMSEAYTVGGHTKLAAQWIALDRGRAHSLLLTRRTEAIPPHLANVVSRTRGSILPIGNQQHGLLAVASEIALAAQDFDVVVLHIHPSDLTAPIGLSSNLNRPPVVFVNHADHVFSAGASSADLLLCFRDSGRSLARVRRHIPDDRIATLPLPIPPRRRVHTIAEAKDALALRRSSVLILTVAQEYKYLSDNGATSPHFLDLVTPVLLGHPHATLVAIGPSNRDRWLAAARRTNGRVRAIGIVEDPFPYREAADIYLDSTPFGSITSLLESALLGTPSLAYTPGIRPDSVLYSDPIGIPDVLMRAQTPAAYRDSLSKLIESESHRRAVGDRLERSLRDVYSTRRWQSSLETIYRSLSVNAVPALELADMDDAPECDQVDKDVLRISLSRHRAFGLADALYETSPWTVSLPWSQYISRQMLRYHRRFTRNPPRLKLISPQWWHLSDRMLMPPELAVWNPSQRLPIPSWGRPTYL